MGKFRGTLKTNVKVLLDEKSEVGRSEGFSSLRFSTPGISISMTGYSSSHKHHFFSLTDISSPLWSRGILSAYAIRGVSIFEVEAGANNKSAQCVWNPEGENSFRKQAWARQARED